MFNIKLATPFDEESFKELFPEIEVLDKTIENKNIDLLIFPGGADVSLHLYLSRAEIEKFRDICNTNPNRDEEEAITLYNALDGVYGKNTKILGICRGVQFLNVMFGGKLYPDINSYGIYHQQYHKLYHYIDSKLSFMETVNSYHHQGVSKVGTFYSPLDLETNPKPIATDTVGEVKEIISWMDDKVLGVQCHPEYYGETFPQKKLFRDAIYSWLYGQPIITKEEKKKYE